MRQCRMRFNGYGWQHNPRSLKFLSEKNKTELLPPFCTSDVRTFGEKPYRIEGEGELFGEDCIEQYIRLKMMFSQAGEGLLSIEGLGSFYVTFVSLEMLAQPKDNLLSYSFAFLEKNREKNEITESIYYTANGEETLWDIAYRYSRPIEELVRLNPGLRYPDELIQGERVRVC